MYILDNYFHDKYDHYTFILCIFYFLFTCYDHSLKCLSDSLIDILFTCYDHSLKCLSDSLIDISKSEMNHISYLGTCTSKSLDLLGLDESNMMNI